MAQSVVMYSTEGGKYPVEEYITKLAKKHKEAELADELFPSLQRLRRDTA